MEDTQSREVYTRVVLNHGFDLPRYYKLRRQIGGGSYGVVFSGVDTRSGAPVAIKRISNLFKGQDLRDSLRTLREIRLLRRLKHENLIALKDLYTPDPPQKLRTVYIITELCDTDLARLLDSGVELSREHIQTLLYQLLRALKYIHSAGVLHRDLKPKNILVNRNCDLKIADFGMGRAAVGLTLTLLDSVWKYSCCADGVLQVTTRWYEAPEGLCCVTHYSTPVDVWSTGCILLEMLTGKPPFPGSDARNQLQLIIQARGTPSSHFIDAIPKESIRQFVQSLPPCNPVPLHELYPGVDEEGTSRHELQLSNAALDLCEQMLTLDSNERITVEKALQVVFLLVNHVEFPKHSYLRELHDPDDEPTAPEVIAEEEEISASITKDQLRGICFCCSSNRTLELFLQEISNFHPELAAH